MSGYQAIPDPEDRSIGTIHDGFGLRVRIGPASYDRNPRIKICESFHDFESGKDAEWIFELTPSEARRLVCLLMEALDEL